MVVCSKWELSRTLNLMTPFETASAFFQALGRKAWREAASFIEPDQACRFQREQVAHMIAGLHFQELLQGPEPHPSGYGSNGILNQQELIERAATPIRGYRDAPTLGDIAALTPAEFLIRRFESGSYPQACRIGPNNETTPLPVRVLGEVSYSNDTVYVLYIYDGDRDPDNPHVFADVPYPHVLPMLQRGDRWYVGFNNDLMMPGPESGFFDEDEAS